MGDTSTASVDKGADDPPPPPYTEDASVVVQQESQALPDYENQAAKGVAATVTPYHPFPSVMNAYYQWNLAGIKTFHVCGTNRDERLYAVEMHSGFSRKPPLGTRPGVLLHNGASAKDPILAAAGAESQFTERYTAYSPDSIILLPTLLPTTSLQYMTTETMHSRTKGGEGVAFFFSIEAGEGDKARRQKFEWRKVKKGDHEAKEGGFKLLRLPSIRQQSATQEGSSSSSPVAKPDNGDVVALFAWTKTLTHLNHPFTLQLLTALGERWALMVLMTALRLWVLHAQGKTKRGFVATAEKSGGK